MEFPDFPGQGGWWSGADIVDKLAQGIAKIAEFEVEVHCLVVTGSWRKWRRGM